MMRHKPIHLIFLTLRIKNFKKNYLKKDIVEKVIRIINKITLSIMLFILIFDIKLKFFLANSKLPNVEKVSTSSL
jgi:hypothetical protein